MTSLGPSLAKQVRASKPLYRMLKPLSDAYANLAGYRQHGLKYDDILIEETPVVQKALGRLTERESYDRAFRLRQASMASIAHAYLPKDKWLPVSEDKRYLKPLVQEVEAELNERQFFDNAVPVGKKH